MRQNGAKKLLSISALNNYALELHRFGFNFQVKTGFLSKKRRLY
jgi:hypothetical protein